LKHPATVIVFALLQQLPAPATAQLAEAECATSWPGFPFPEGIFLESAQRTGLDPALLQFATRDAVRGGQPPTQPAVANSPRWIWHSDLAAVAKTSDLGIYISRFNEFPGSRVRGGTDGYIVSAWAFIAKGTRKLIANTWLHEKNDRRPLRSQCGIQIRSLPGGLWSSAPRAPDVSKVAAAVPPPPELRDADNELIAQTTCRDRWPGIMAATGDDHGHFLLPSVGEVIGGANLRPILDNLPDEPVRWRRLKFLASRDGKLGVSIGKLVNCDDPKRVQTYVTAWVRNGERWRLELLAIAP
jgi:hypothetical protein